MNRRPEYALAGAIIGGDLAKVETEGVRPEFFETGAGAVMKASLRLRAAGKAVDFDALTAELPDTLDGLAVSDALGQMAEAYTTPTLLPPYAAEVRGAWIRRETATAHAAIAEAVCDGKPEVETYWRGKLADIERMAEGAGERGRLVLVSDAELVARNTPLPPPLVEGLVNQGELCMVVAPAKTGKSWYALQLARAIASGVPFLGRATAKGAVVYLNTEIPAVYWESRVRALEGAMPESHGAALYHACTRGLDLNIENVVPKLRRAIEDAGLKQVAALILDPIYTLASGIDENASGAVATIMLGLQRLAEELGAAVVVVHHCGKGDAASKSVLDMARGSSAFVGAVDSFIGLAKLPDGRVLFRGLRRNGGDPAPRYLRFDFPLWVDDGEADAETINPGKPGRDKKHSLNDIMEAFTFDGETLKGADIQKRTRIPKSAVYRLCKEAVDAGFLIRDGDRYTPADADAGEDF